MPPVSFQSAGVMRGGRKPSHTMRASAPYSRPRTRSFPEGSGVAGHGLSSSET
jgi:hypothetical protein